MLFMQVFHSSQTPISNSWRYALESVASKLTRNERANLASNKGELDMIARQLLSAAIAGSAIAAANPAAALPTFDFAGVQLSGGTGNNAAVQTYLNNTVGV